MDGGKIIGAIGVSGEPAHRMTRSRRLERPPLSRPTYITQCFQVGKLKAIAAE